MEGHRDQISRVDIPGPGDDLEGRVLARVDLAHPHMVGIGVAFHGLDAAHHDVGDLRPQIGGALHLGAGEGHGLGELAVGCVYLNELIEPLSR